MGKNALNTYNLIVINICKNHVIFIFLILTRAEIFELWMQMLQNKFEWWYDLDEFRVALAKLFNYTLRTTKLLGDILVSLHLSGWPTSSVRPVAPTVLIGYFSYLYILSRNITRCVICNVSCKFKNLNFSHFLKICYYDFVFFWLGIGCESLAWVIMGWQGVSKNSGILVVPISSCSIVK